MANYYQTNKLDLRKEVIKRAMGQWTDGAHYLWGADGGTPNEKGEVRFVDKNLTDPKKELSFCAATCSSGGRHVCGGRFQRLTNTQTPSGIISGWGDGNLQSFIADNGSKSEVNWGLTLTPRLMSGSTVPTQMVWGEGCDGTRHFDCIHFVNRCLGGDIGEPGKSKISFDIANYFYSVEDRNRILYHQNLRGYDVTEDDDFVPADILIYGTIVPPSNYSDFYTNKVTADTTRLNADNDASKSADVIKSDQSTLDSDQKNLDSYGADPTGFSPKYGIGVNLHHIALCTGVAQQIIQADSTPMGITMGTTPGRFVRRVRLDDSIFQ